MMSIVLIPCGRKIAEVAWPAYERKKGGTCDFMTANCKKYCKLTANEIEQASLEFVEDNPVHIVVRQMIKDIIELEATVIAWWLGAGDCPERLTDKVLDIMEELSKAKILQNGFTRNKHLHRMANGINNVRIALTVEKGAKQEFEHSREGMLIAEPDYEKGVVNLYVHKRGESKFKVTGAGCGGGYVIHRLEKGKPPKAFIEDCSLCLKDGVGCYNLIPIVPK